MRIAYLDCTAGVAGDLIVGALVDLGLAPEQVRALLAALTPAAYDLQVDPVRLPTGPATTVTLSVVAPATPDELRAAAGANLPAGVAERAVAALDRLFAARTAVSGIPGTALDPIEATADAGLVAAAIGGLAAIGVERVHASAVNVGRPTPPAPLPMREGAVIANPPTGEGDAIVHPPLALGEGRGEGNPAVSAVALEILRGGVVSVGPGPAWVTPAGAAVVATVVSAFGSLPPVRLDRIGYGAGRDGGVPVRILLGDTAGAVEAGADWVTVVECNLDDMSPQVYEHVFALLFAAGALDVSVTPLVMKKGRPAAMLSAIGLPEDAEHLARIVLRETTTLGVRLREMPRRTLRRTFETVETPYGPIAVKVAWANGLPLRAMPEYEECRRAALAHGVPLQQVVDAARAAWMLKR